MKYFIVLSLLFSFSITIHSQMTINGEVKYGNEWIDYDKNYVKLEVAEDRIYKVTYQELIDQGISPSTLIGKDIQLIHLGQPTAVFTTNQDIWSSSDYLLFYGERNDVTIDKHLYTDWSNQMLNTEYSLFNDDAAYFLTINPDSSNPRYTEATNNLSGSLPLAENAYMHRAIQVFSNSHYKPVIQDVKYSNFVETEGFGTRPELTTEINFEIKNQVTGEGNTTVEIRSGSNNPVSTVHNITLTLNGDAIKTDSYTQNRVKYYKEEVSTEALTSNTKLVIAGAAGSNTNLTIPYAAITYPRAFDFDNADYWEFVLESSFFDRYIEIENFEGGSAPKLFNITTQKFQVGLVENGFTKYKISPQTENAQFVIINESTATKPVKAISARNFVDYSQVSPSYMILTSKRLNNDDGGTNIVAEYAQYRSTALGGGYDTYVVNIEDVYDQFAYGIDRHNIAPRNFAHYAQIIWPNLEYWFNVGKGLEYNLIRNESQITSNGNLNFVPTFGAPGSDALMLSSLGEANPMFFFGRIAVSSKAELREYFEKVKQHNDLSTWEQTVEGKLWTKEMIHLSGGDPNIQESIYSSLESMRNSIENNKFGAKVHTIRKYSSDPIQTSQSQEVLNLINNGVSIITFFGHSAVGTFDFSLEDPSQYDNTGKYPMIISLGCLSGNVHTTSRGLSEDFVLEPQKGSIAFLAASGTAYVNTQARSGKLFYDLLGGDYYGGTVGEIIKKLYEDTADNTSVATRTLMQQLTLHGDPALKINPHEGVDYTIDKSSVTTNPTVVSTNVPSFDLNFEIANIGFSQNDSINIFIQHIGPSGSVFQEKTVRIAAPYYKNEITVTLNAPTVSEIGKNTIEIIVDSADAIVELPDPAAENNNRLTELTNGTGYCFYVLDNGIIPVFPSNFGILNKDCTFELKASTNNAFLDEQTYLFEIDTTELFNSPLLEKGQVTAKGGLITYVPSIPKVENQVYYWRVSPPISDVGYLWSNSSFIYMENGEEGWNQSHYYQFLKNDLTNYELLENRQFDFPDEFFDMLMNVRVPDGDVVPRMFQNSTTSGKMKLWELPFDGIGVALKKAENFSYIENTIPGSFGSYAQGGTQRIFFFKTDNEEDRISLVNFLEDEIEDGDHVFLFTVTNSMDSQLNADEWGLDSLNNNNRNIFNTLEKEGAQFVRNLPALGTVPYGIFYSKNTGVRDEAIGFDISSVISLNSLYSRNLSEGVIRTTIVKESQNWKNLEWKLNTVEGLDSVYVNVYAIDNNNVETLVYEKETISPLSLDDLNEISTSALLVEIFMKDELNKTSPQIEYLRISHTPRADISINTNDDSYSFKSDTLNRGEQLELKLPVYNYTNTDFNNCEAKITIIDAQNGETTETVALPLIPKKSSVLLNWSKETRELQGLYQWTIELNYQKNPIEQHYFNNIGVGTFFVKDDKKNPTLDLTFDGVHIANGDIVSSKPEIVITSVDDNQYLLLDDPELFEIFVEYPDGSFQNVDSSGPNIEFITADPSDSDNKASIIYNPELDQDGTYTLTAQSRDQSGNFSGENAYEITFEVITKKSISNVLNYPNPFSTSTQFVFTVTGDEAPAGMMINIYTLSGKLIRQITPDELGPVHVGHNRTNYKWNGTDEYGERLANGVYLYKVIFDQNVQDNFETYFTESDSYFKNGFSKMVIMR